ncbi:MAG: hypothetical protein JJE18_03345 [Eubacteriaceae bacterium]|nr:hypothetical protein [Eubacteriaceae bacterium]
MNDEIKEFFGYHGTPERCIDSIKNDGFKVRTFLFDCAEEQEIPCDLGNGIYVFLDNDEYGFDGKECAKKYVKNVKRGELSYGVIELSLSIDFENQEIVDLDDEEIISEILAVRKVMMPKLKRLFEENYFKNNGAFQRGNCDGIILEGLLLEKKSDPVMIIKNTYTSESYYRISNFPDGTEACIRDISIIKNKEVCEKFH